MRLLNGEWRLLYLISPLLHIFGFTVLFWGPLFTPYYFLFWMSLQTFYSIYAVVDTIFKLLSTYKSTRNYIHQQKERIVSPSQPIHHVIILPNYKEDIHLLRQTLRNLASHTLSKSNYYVALAQEEVEEDSVKKAETLIHEFKCLFKDIFYTVHPFGITDELQGKASNVNWAVRQAFKILVNGRNIDVDDILVTVADADSIIPEEFFTFTGEQFSTTPSPREVFFVAPPIYSVNSLKVSAFQRAVDLAHATLVMMQQRNYCGQSFPYSTFAISLKLIQNADFWDCQPEAIGDDFHMYLKCFYKSQGRMTKITCPVPIFLASVESENIWKSLYGRYKQTIRHMLGLYDIAYASQMFCKNFTRISIFSNIVVLYITLESLLTFILIPYFQLGMILWRWLPVADGYLELFEMYRFTLSWLLAIPVLAFMVSAIVYEKIYSLTVNELKYHPRGEQRSWYHCMDWPWVLLSTPFYWMPALVVSFTETFPRKNLKFTVSEKGTVENESV